MQNYNSESYLFCKKLDLSEFQDFDLISLIRSSLNRGKTISEDDLNSELLSENKYMIHCVHQKEITTNKDGSFLEFLFGMILTASYDPPAAIKYNFDKYRLKNTLKTKDNETLYILSKGRFGTEKFICLSTSANKYTPSEYLILKEEKTNDKK